MMQEAIDFRDESDALYALVADLAPPELERATLFKGWTIDEIIRHLHFWNRAADLSLTDEAAFMALAREAMRDIETVGLRAKERAMLDGLAGPALLSAWRAQYADMGARWSALDPKLRVKWVGPDMSVRSSITARHMETWAHGLAVFDLLGAERAESDRIRNVVVLGVNTFGWTHKVHGLETPATMPWLRLSAPSGEVWEFGEPAEDERIEGAALEFCQVVTQTRNIADTSLAVRGENATRWMAIAQCFAGPPERPPEPGARHRAAPGQGAAQPPGASA
jgi:uncharacterized protein (TIGR03084 family)